MRIAFLHHHLRPGGVTRVIDEQIRSLVGNHECVIISGEEPPAPHPCPVRVVRCIGYDRDLGGETEPESCARAVLSEIGSLWHGGADILHVHNPTLGKNRSLLGMIRCMAGEGERLLLHIHDFAEDGRPGNYRTGEPWPADCHYAVLNGRDYRILREAGFAEEGVHLLPNPVRPLLPVGRRDGGEERPSSLRDASPSGGRTFLYPVRAIRRKNIGEAVLLSLFVGGDDVGVTLEPTGSRDVESYEKWRSLVRVRGLRVRFALGVGRDYAEVLRQARCMITTSIKEGFGFSYLEPWTAGLMLHGRRLPGICDDFEARGIDLSSLYERLDVPLSLIDIPRGVGALLCREDGAVRPLSRGEPIGGGIRRALRRENIRRFRDAQRFPAERPRLAPDG
jgi:glycosyltransferase involved in cell wall biosynthesis